jgi:hypothetical protein
MFPVLPLLLPVSCKVRKHRPLLTVMCFFQRQLSGCDSQIKI